MRTSDWEQRFFRIYSKRRRKEYNKPVACFFYASLVQIYTISTFKINFFATHVKTKFKLLK